MYTAALSLIVATLLRAAPAGATPVICLGTVDVKGAREGVVALLKERTRTLVSELGGRLGQAPDCQVTLHLSALRVGPAVQVGLVGRFAHDEPPFESSFTEPYDRFPMSPELAQALARLITELRNRFPVAPHGEPTVGDAAVQPSTDASSPPALGTVTASQPLLGVGVPAVAAFATGTVATGVGLFFGISARGHYDKAKDPELVGRQLELAAARRDQRAANVSYGAAVVSVAVGAALAILLTPEEER